jgi:hypothetical protein
VGDRRLIAIGFRRLTLKPTPENQFGPSGLQNAVFAKRRIRLQPKLRRRSSPRTTDAILFALEVDWVFAANLRIDMCSIMRQRNGLIALFGHGDAPV